MRLMFMRHANTESGVNKADVQRILTDLGKNEAEQAAEFLKNYQIDKVIVSHAKRAMQTAKIITDRLELNGADIASELYEGDEDAIINVLSSQESYNKHLLVIGHNPLIYNVLLSMVNNNSNHYNDLIESAMPTACIVIIDFNNIVNWENLRKNMGEVVNIFTPVI